MITVDGIPLCIASGGSVEIVRTIFSADRGHLAVVGRVPDSSLRVYTFAREQPKSAGAFWAEVGKPSIADSIETAESLAQESLKTTGADS